MKIFFIDPMSYGSIAQYDRCLLNGVNDSKESFIKIEYFCSYLNTFDYNDTIRSHKVFFYNKLPTSILKGFSYILSYLIIIAYAILIRPDCIHIQWIRKPVLDYRFLKLFQKFNIKVIYTAHNVLPHNNDNNNVRFVYSKYYKTVDTIIVHSDTTKKELIDIFNLPSEKIHVIFHGLLPNNLNEEQISNESCIIKRDLNIDNKIVFSCLGVQSHYKGVDLIVDAWAKNKFLHNNPNIFLIIAGRSKDINFSEVSKFSNVHIEDCYLSDERYIAFLRISSATILPYRKISQSGALLTALNERTPVIVSHVGGLPDPLAMADIGWDIGDPTVTNIEKVLVNLSNNPSSMHKKKWDIEEWDKLFKDLSWKEIGRKTLLLYNQTK